MFFEKQLKSAQKKSTNTIIFVICTSYFYCFEYLTSCKPREARRCERKKLNRVITEKNYIFIDKMQLKIVLARTSMEKAF